MSGAAETRSDECVAEAQPGAEEGAQRQPSQDARHAFHEGKYNHGVAAVPWTPDHPVDAALAARLVAEQFPDLAGAPVERVVWRGRRDPPAARTLVEREHRAHEQRHEPPPGIEPGQPGTGATAPPADKKKDKRGKGRKDR